MRKWPFTRDLQRTIAGLDAHMKHPFVVTHVQKLFLMKKTFISNPTVLKDFAICHPKRKDIFEPEVTTQNGNDDVE